MLYNIEAERLSAKKSFVRVHYFPGAALVDMEDYIRPLARKQPSHMIIHCGTKDLTSTESENEIVERLQHLVQLIKSFSPRTHIVLSNLITRIYDNNKYTNKVDLTNIAIGKFFKSTDIDIIDTSNIGKEFLAKKRLHLSIKKGNAKFALNLKSKIKST